MSDQTLLVFGCAITFMSFAGAYVALRQQFLAGLRERRAQRRGAKSGSKPIPQDVRS